MDSVLEATGSLSNYADPSFELNAKGKVDLGELDALTGIDGLDGGVADLQLTGKGSLEKYALDGTAKLTGVAYVTSDVRARGVNASTQVHLDQDDLNLTKLKIQLRDGGSIEGDMKLLHWAAPDPLNCRRARKANWACTIDFTGHIACQCSKYHAENGLTDDWANRPQRSGV